MIIIKDGDEIIFDISSKDDKDNVHLFDGEILISSLPFDECNVTIPDNVTKIADYAFDDGCESITSIKIPSSVTSIGDGAFLGCEKLKSIVVDPNNTVYDSRNNCNAIIETATNTLIRGCQNTVIPEDVTSIGDGAFFGCKGLRKINLPNSLKSIGTGAFTATGLTDIEIPYNVNDIGINTFYGCKDLRSVKIPEHVKIYEISADYQFEGCPCKIKKYWVYKYGKANPAVVKGDVVIDHNIEDGEYRGCRKITSIKITDGVTKIGEHAFENCSNLESISIPNSVTNIGAAVFRGCKKLKNIVLPYQVKTIEKYSFEGCRRLEKIEMSPYVEHIERLAFSGCESLTTIELPELLPTVGTGIFDYCYSLREITIMNKSLVFSDLLMKKDDYFFDVDVSKCTVVVPNDIDKFRLREYIDAFSPIERRVQYWHQK